MNGRPIQRLRHRSERGAAAVEFALVVIPLLYILFGVLSYGYMFSFRQALSQSASEAARAAIGSTDTTAVSTSCNGSSAPYSAVTCPAQYAAAAAIANSLATYNLSCSGGFMTCTITVGDSTVVSTCAATHTCVKVVVSYPYRAHSLLPNLPGYGSVLPSNLTFTSVVQLT